MGLNAPSTMQRYDISLNASKKNKKTLSMDAKNIEKLVEKAKNDILQEVNDRLPRKVDGMQNMGLLLPDATT